MDAGVIEQLEQSGIDPTPKVGQLRIPIQVSEAGFIEPLGAEVFVQSRDAIVPVQFKDISRLFTGTREPPSFRKGPTPEYEPFFMLVELTVIDYCLTAGQPERDTEFERLYTLLRRRPETRREDNPLFTYLRASTQLYMSVADVSRAEFEAVIGRLARSARTFKTHPTSSNYFDVGLRTILDEVQARA